MISAHVLWVVDQVLAEFTIILIPLAWVNEIGKTEKKQDHGFCDHGIWFLVVSTLLPGFIFQSLLGLRLTEDVDVLSLPLLKFDLGKDPSTPSMAGLTIGTTITGVLNKSFTILRCSGVTPFALFHLSAKAICR